MIIKVILQQFVLSKVKIDLRDKYHIACDRKETIVTRFPFQTMTFQVCI